MADVNNSGSKTPERMEPLTPAVKVKTPVAKVTPAKSPGPATGKVTPGRSPAGDESSTGTAKAATPFSKEKTTLKQITVKMMPKGCFETLRHCEEKTSHAMQPLTEILKDCRIDTKKEKYEDNILKCFENASLISNLAQFTGQI